MIGSIIPIFQLWKLSPERGHNFWIRQSVNGKVGIEHYTPASLSLCHSGPVTQMLLCFRPHTGVILSSSSLLLTHSPWRQVFLPKNGFPSAHFPYLPATVPVQAILMVLLLLLNSLGFFPLLTGCVSLGKFLNISGLERYLCKRELRLAPLHWVVLKIRRHAVFRAVPSKRNINARLMCNL